MEGTVEKLRTILEGNRIAIQDMTQSKKLALDMAKQLRDKYEAMQISCKSLTAQIDKLKVRGEVNIKFILSFKSNLVKPLKKFESNIPFYNEL